MPPLSGLHAVARGTRSSMTTLRTPSTVGRSGRADGGNDPATAQPSRAPAVSSASIGPCRIRSTSMRIATRSGFSDGWR